jgi:hypothetical protein
MRQAQPVARIGNIIANRFNKTIPPSGAGIYYILLNGFYTKDAKMAVSSACPFIQQR